MKAVKNAAHHAPQIMKKPWRLYTWDWDTPDTSFGARKKSENPCSLPPLDIALTRKYPNNALAFSQWVGSDQFVQILVYHHSDHLVLHPQNLAIRVKPGHQD